MNITNDKTTRNKRYLLKYVKGILIFIKIEILIEYLYI